MRYKDACQPAYLVPFFPGRKGICGASYIVIVPSVR